MVDTIQFIIYYSEHMGYRLEQLLTHLAGFISVLAQSMEQMSVSCQLFSLKVCNDVKHLHSGGEAVHMAAETMINQSSGQVPVFMGLFIRINHLSG